jgi:hypothetical protein
VDVVSALFERGLLLSAKEFLYSGQLRRMTPLAQWEVEEAADLRATSASEQSLSLSARKCVEALCVALLRRLPTESWPGWSRAELHEIALCAPPDAGVRLLARSLLQQASLPAGTSPSSEAARVGVTAKFEPLLLAWVCCSLVGDAAGVQAATQQLLLRLQAVAKHADRAQRLLARAETITGSPELFAAVAAEIRKKPLPPATAAAAPSAAAVPQSSLNAPV